MKIVHSYGAGEEARHRVKQKSGRPKKFKIRQEYRKYDVVPNINIQIRDVADEMNKPHLFRRGLSPEIYTKIVF